MKQELIEEVISELEAMERLVRRQFPEFVHPLIAKLRAAPVQEPMADFDDPQVQAVYEILCDDDEAKPREEHWQGYKARRIVDALAAQRQPLTAKDISLLWRRHTDMDGPHYNPYEDDGLGFARAIEAAHGIK